MKFVLLMDSDDAQERAALEKMARDMISAAGARLALGCLSPDEPMTMRVARMGDRLANDERGIVLNQKQAPPGATIIQPKSAAEEQLATFLAKPPPAPRATKPNRKQRRLQQRSAR